MMGESNGILNLDSRHCFFLPPSSAWPWGWCAALYRRWKVNWRQDIGETAFLNQQPSYSGTPQRCSCLWRNQVPVSCSSLNFLQLTLIISLLYKDGLESLLLGHYYLRIWNEWIFVNVWPKKVKQIKLSNTFKPSF